MSDLKPYQYVVLRCVPRVEREEFLNVGAVLYAQAFDYLEAAWVIDEQRLTGFAPDLDVDAVRAALEFVAGVCRGDVDRVGAAAEGNRGVRFGWVKAPRSTVLQPGPVHGGLTLDPALALDRILTTHVTQPIHPTPDP